MLKESLEKLDIIETADQWMNYRLIRNKLTHEYSSNQQEMLAGIQLAMLYFKEIKKILESINRYVQEKKWLHI